MAQIEETIRCRARARVADIFGLTLEALPLNAEFGTDLKASFVSDFKDNEFDKLDYDIKDVANNEIRKQLESGSLVIRTVADYCEHMVRCFSTSPDEVTRLLDLGRSG